MNQDAGDESTQLPALSSQGNASVAEIINTVFTTDDDPLVLINQEQQKLKQLSPETGGDAFPKVQLALQSLGELFLGQKFLERINFTKAHDQFLAAAEGFRQIGEDELYNLATGFRVFSEANVALQQLSIGRARELLTQIQDYIQKAGKFGLTLESLSEQLQPDILFLQGFEKAQALDFSAARPLIEQASYVSGKIANDSYAKDTSEYFLFLGMSHYYRGIYRALRAFNDFNHFNYDSLTTEADLKSEVVQARDLLSKVEDKSPVVEGAIHLCNGISELLDLLGQLAPMMQMVFNSTFKPDPQAYDSLRQKIRRAKDSFVHLGPLGPFAAIYDRQCEQLFDQINNLERFAKPQPVATTVLPIIILVHGIRTFASWLDTLRAEFQSVGFKVELTNYEYFDLIRFLLPWQRSRKKAIRRVLNQIRRVQVLHPGARISILAHSFGTYIVAEILREEFDIKVDRLVFCGSIVPSSYPLHRVVGQIAAGPIVNDVGSRDIWPALADSVTKGYGRTGTYGFHVPGVLDRWHDGAHSMFLTDDFCKKFWIPFFLHGTQVEGDKIHKQPPLWLRLVSVFKVKYVVPLVLLAMLLWRIWSIWPAEFRVRIDAPENVGYLGPTIEALVAKLEEPCSRWTEWLTFWQRRCAKIEYEGEAVRTLVVSRPFDRTSRDPLALLLELREVYTPCLVVEGVEQRQLRIDLKDNGLTTWRAPTGAVFRLCRPDSNATTVLTKRHGGS